MSDPIISPESEHAPQPVVVERLPFFPIPTEYRFTRDDAKRVFLVLMQPGVAFSMFFDNDGFRKFLDAGYNELEASPAVLLPPPDDTDQEWVSIPVEQYNRLVKAVKNVTQFIAIDALTDPLMKELATAALAELAVVEAEVLGA